MKNILNTLILFIAVIGFSQNNGITYQAVIYGPNGQQLPGANNKQYILSNKTICLQFSIIDHTGTVEYQETIVTTTDKFGMVNLLIGSGTQENGYASGFNGILWNVNSKSLKVELDPSQNCQNFTEISNNPFTYVPFAYYSANPGNPGPQGEQGEQGPAGVNGTNGLNGVNGLSAYQTWLNLGNSGSETDFITSLTGPIGPQGVQGSNGSNGLNGVDGLSAYQTWLNLGNSGSEADFITSLTGPIGPQGVQGSNGTNGLNGVDGLSAYQTWLNLGNSGSEADFITSLTGPAGTNGLNGVNGLSAYQTWLNLGNSGSEADFITSLTGPAGPQGAQGPAGNGFQNGTTLGQIMYWNGSEWTIINPGLQAQILTFCYGVPTWTSDGVCPEAIATLSCGTATNTGTLISGTAASGVSRSIPYTGGNGGSHNGQTITSTGVTGLTATLTAGTFASGTGSLVYTITGTPASAGTASFALNIGGRTCILTVGVGIRANAGPDQCNIDGTFGGGGTVCGSNGRGWLKINLSGNTPPSGGIGVWSVIASSAAGCVGQISNGSWVFSGKPSGNYTLRYTITVNGVSTFDDMRVCFNSCKNYTITRSGGTNQYTFNYHTCNDLSSGLNTIANGTSITICAFPGSVSTSWPTNIIITTNNRSCN